MRQGIMKLTPLGYKKLTVSTTVVGLSAADVPNGTVAFYMQAADGNAVRWTADGSTPAAGTDGHILSSSIQWLGLHQFHPGRLRFVRDGAADGTVIFTFFGE